MTSPFSCYLSEDSQYSFMNRVIQTSNLEPRAWVQVQVQTPYESDWMSLPYL